MEKTDKIEEAANHYASVTDPEAHGIDFIREVFIAGAECDREQMLKDAVEGEVVKDISNKLAVTAKINLDGFKFGDKVRVIIVKEDEK